MIQTTPDKAHAVFSASGSHRWMNCPGSIRLEALMPSSTSDYAEEGTVAHEFVELYLKHCIADDVIPDCTELLKKPFAAPEMEMYAAEFAHFVFDEVAGMFQHYTVLSETRVDYSAYAEGGFGTADCIVLGDDTLVVIDYKYGKGVRVDAENNSQLKLYALGAYLAYNPVCGIESIMMYIYQPRLNHISMDRISVDELLTFAYEVRHAVNAAKKPDAPCNAGDWCRFCRAKAECRARAEAVLRLAYDTKPDLLTDDELGEALKTGELVAAWVADVKAHAMKLLLSGRRVKGFRLVEGRSTRKWKNEDEAFKYILGEGLAPEAMLYERKPITLTAVEKLLGKKAFRELESFVTKPQGAPTIVPEDDKRPDYTLDLTRVFPAVRETE